MKKTVPLIVGNWKLNPAKETDAVALAKGVAKLVKKQPAPYVVIAPSFVHVSSVKKALGGSAIQLAVQTLSSHNLGAYTGEISGLQLKDLGVTMVIIGHSERRAMGETNEQVGQKVLSALKHKLVPIVCVGERERDEQANFFGFIEEQLRSLSAVLTSAQMKQVVLAYEPIWAIGTGATATADDVKEMQLFIESTLTKLYDRPTAKKVRVLYGGSVKPQNAADLHTHGGMNGFLVGGASLKAEDFYGIIQAVK